MAATLRKRRENTLERMVPVLLVASLMLAFAVGILWQKVANLEGGGARTAGTSTGTSGSAATPSSDRPSQGKLSEAQAKEIPEVSDSDHVRGNRDAKVFLIEYSDLECPFCSRFHPTAQQLVDEYGGDVAWVYRHLPLDSIHPKAREAAEASECVAELGGEDSFWAFIDKIFEDQTGTLNNLNQTASGVGIDQDSFESCLNSQKYAERVENDYQSAISMGYGGTPSNLIVSDKGEAWYIPGAQPISTFKQAIDEALGN